MARKPARRDEDALLTPFSSKLPEAPERQVLSGAGVIIEASRFWSHRMNAYASYFDKLTQCKTITDVAALQATFWSDAQRDYANEGAAMIAAATLTGAPTLASDALPLPWLAIERGQSRADAMH